MAHGGQGSSAAGAALRDRGAVVTKFSIARAPALMCIIVVTIEDRLAPAALVRGV
jgi:hypothetical protein